MQQGLHTTGTQKYIHKSLHLHIDSNTYIIEGDWRIVKRTHHKHLAEFRDLKLSFNYWIGTDKMNFLIHPDDIEQARTTLDSLQKGLPVNYRIKVITQTGYIETLMGAALLMRDANWEEVRIDGMIEETKDGVKRKTLSHVRAKEQKLIIRSLNRSRHTAPASRDDKGVSHASAEYRILFETLDEGFANCQLIRNKTGEVIDFRFLHGNAAMQQHTGVSLSDFAGRLLSETSIVSQQWWIDTASRVVSTRQPEHLELYNPATALWHEVTLSPYSADRFTMFFHNITEYKEAEEDLKKAKGQKTFLLTLSDTLQTLNDPIDIEYEAARLVAQKLSCDHGHYVEISDDENIVTIRRDYVYGNIPSAAGIYNAEDFATVLALSGMGCVAIDNVPDSPQLSDNEKEILERLSIRALLFVGLFKDNKSVAGMAVAQTSSRTWTSTEMLLLEAAAERAWLFVEKAKGEKALRQSEEKVHTLFTGIENVLSGYGIANPQNRSIIEALAAQAQKPVNSATGLTADQIAALQTLTNRNAALEQHVAERTHELEESRALIEHQNTSLYKILNAIPQMIWVLDNHGKIRFVNDRWHSYTGITEEQCVDKDAKRCDIFHPGHKKEIADKWEFLSTHNKRHVGEVMIKNQAGHYRWHLDITEPILDEQGNIEMWVGSFIYVHEQFTSEKESKESRDLLQAVFDASTNAIAVFDTLYDDSNTIIDFETLYINKYASHFFNEDDLKQKSLLKLFKRHNKPELFERFKNVINTGKPFDLTYRVMRDNEEKWYHLVCIKLADGLVVTQNDISAQIKAQNELMLLNKSLKEKNHELKLMNEELANFTFVTSHDLREPLRKIQLFAADIIEQDGDKMEERSRLFCQKIVTAVQRMNDLIEDILTYSRVATQPKREHKATDLNKVLDQITTNLGETIRQTGARLVVGKLPVFHCNAFQIAQLLENLISNALKFKSEKHNPEIHISSATVAGDTIQSPLANDRLTYLKLEVADNGIGFDGQYSEKIFGIFQRLHRRNSYAGLGMGLAICKKITQNHKGFIMAKGDVDKGAAFTCYFPIAEVSQEPG